jgi:AraC-like DNA-binding protein
MPDLLPLYFVPGRPAEETEAVDTGPEPAHRTELTAFMKTHRPYLQSELSLQDLAKQMELPQHVLSRRINSAFGQNFNDFVNAYRVEAVKEMLLSGDAGHLSLLGIAYECGFNSKATFNRVFRKFTGQSPTEFRKAQHPKGDSD